jgi:glycine/D-amino acid oxidase-like deaminating enzyme
MGPYVDSITPDESMPASTSVVVVGGGIIGTSAALALAARGIPVVLCEKAYIGCEQSSRNWGWCRQTGRDEREMPLIVESLKLWRDMDRLTQSATGFRECGVVYVGESESDECSFAAWLEMARPHDIGARIVRGAELDALLPGAQGAFRCGLHVPSDGCAEPQKAAPAIARAALRGQGDRAERRKNPGRRHGARSDRLRYRHSCWGRLDEPVLREPRGQASAVEGTVVGAADGTRSRRPADLHVFGRGRLP